MYMLIKSDTLKNIADTELTTHKRATIHAVCSIMRQQYITTNYKTKILFTVITTETTFIAN
jgi:hypothetical protein